MSADEDSMPAIGTSLELVLLDRKGAEEHVLAKIMDETPKGWIVASFEAGEGFKLPDVWSLFKARFHKRDAGYEFDTILLQKKDSPIKIAYIAKPRRLLRRQLRAYLRVDCKIPIEVIRRDDKKRNVLAGTVTNLSGGGMLCSLPSGVPPEVMLELKFDLGAEETIANISAKILSIRPGDDGSKIHVLQFEGIDEEQRTAIIRHTFALQRKAQRPKE